MSDNKFKSGDLVRQKTSSKYSHKMTVVGYVDQEEEANFVSKISGKPLKEITHKSVKCSYFLYGKIRQKHFLEDQLVFA